MINKFKYRQFFQAINFIVALIFFQPVHGSNFTPEEEEIIKLLQMFNNKMNFITSRPDLRKALYEVLETVSTKQNIVPSDSKYTLITLDQAKEITNYISRNDLALDTNKSEQQQNSTPITSDILPHLYGRVEVKFEGMAPLCSTGIAINPYTVLTAASAITWPHKEYQWSKFYYYSSTSEIYDKFIYAQNIVKPTKFSRWDETNDTALLKLKENIKYLKDINYNLSFSVPPQLQSTTYAFYGFEAYRHYLQSCAVTPIQTNSEDKNFIHISGSVVNECGGAPLWVVDRDHYYLAGTYIRGSDSNHKILKIDPVIIAEMIHADRLYWQATSNNKESQLLKINV